MALWYMTTPVAVRVPWFADTLVASKEGPQDFSMTSKGRFG